MEKLILDAIIFDHDGILVDSVTPDFMACQALCEQYRFLLSPQRFAEDICGHVDGYRAFFREIAASSGVPEEHLDNRLRALWEQWLTTDHVTLQPGVATLLPALRSAGYRLAIASAANSSWVSRWLTHFDLREFFEVVVCREQVSRPKPEPEIYLKTAALLGVAPARCLVFEDSPVGVQAAKSAGMRVAAVPTRVCHCLDFPQADWRLAGLDSVSLPLENMLKSCESPANVWDKGAEEYASLTSQISFYRESAAAVVDGADVQSGMSVVDLACGSGHCITRLLDEPARQPRVVYGLDSSAGMLGAAARRISSSCVSFIQGAAENVDSLVPEKVDRIICNSGFLFFDRSRAGASIRRALTPGGTFVFSLPEWCLDRKQSREHPRYASIDAQLKLRGLPAKPQRGAAVRLSFAEMTDPLVESGLAVEEIKGLAIDVGVDSWRKYYSISSMAEMSLPHLPLSTALEVLQAAIDDLAGKYLPPVHWTVCRMRLPRLP